VSNALEKTEYRPRLQLDCSEELLLRCQQLFMTPGLRNKVVARFMNYMLDEMSVRGEIFAAGVAYSNGNLLDVLNHLTRRNAA